MLRRLTLIVVLLVGAAAPARADVGGPAIIGYVNAERAANGIPAGITENPDWSAGCVLHNQYLALNHVFTHDEDPSLPGATPAGALAGSHAVIYGGSHWTPASDPFEHAPIHLHQLLAPRLDVMGAAETGDYGCATTLLSRNRPAPPADVTYTFPGDGATDWETDEYAGELPFTPGEVLGIPPGSETGPYLYVMFDGPELTPFSSAQVTSASLAGPAGLVALAVADNTTPRLEGYLPTGAELIPRVPLDPHAQYTATVTARVDGAVDFTHQWTFNTGGRSNRVAIAGWSWGGGQGLTVRVRSSAPGGTVTATRAGASVSAPIDADGSARLSVSDGTWSTCATTGGGDFAEATGCADITLATAFTPPALATAFTPPALAPPPRPAATAVRTPALRLVSTRAARHGTRLQVQVRCSAPCALRAIARLRSGKAQRALPTVRARTSATATLRFTLTRATRRWLARHRRARLGLAVSAPGFPALNTTLRL